MAGFTEEEVEALRDVLRSLQRIQQVFVQIMVRQAERRVRAHIDALHLALVRKGLVTPEELDEATREVAAGVAVEEALNPEFRADDIKRLLREAGG